MELKLKKKRLLKQNPEYWDGDEKVTKASKIPLEEIMSNKKLKKKFILPEVKIFLKQQTKQVRKLAEYFSFFNNWIFEQQQNFIVVKNKKTLSNFSEYAAEEVKLVTQSHLIWVELTSHLHDFTSKVDNWKKKKDIYLLSG